MRAEHREVTAGEDSRRVSHGQLEGGNSGSGRAEGSEALGGMQTEDVFAEPRASGGGAELPESGHAESEVGATLELAAGGVLLNFLGAFAFDW